MPTTPTPKKTQTTTPPHVPTLEDLTAEGIAQLIYLSEFTPQDTKYFISFYGAVSLARNFADAAPHAQAQSLFLSAVAFPALRSLATAGKYKEARQLIASLAMLPVQGQEIGQTEAGAARLSEMSDELETYAA